jgi:imidazolonepropionase-like amidohydrolase
MLLTIMKRLPAFRCLPLIASLGLAYFCSELVAQDVAITSTRIITVTGPVIESGTIIVRGGKIVSATAGSASSAGLKVIDGRGMTAMPGYIDAHKHVDKFNKDQAESVLEAGYTTVLSGGGTAEDNLKLAQNIDAGVFNGPHIIPSASLPVAARDFRTILDKGTLVGLTPDAARAAIREMAAKGIRHTGEIVMAPGGPSPEDTAVLKAAVDEGKKAGVQINVHAVSTPAMTGSVDAGITRLVHMPNKDFTGHEDAKKVANTGSIVLGLLAFGAPIIDRYSGPPAQVQFPKDDSPRFRDGKPWPEGSTEQIATLPVKPRVLRPGSLSSTLGQSGTPVTARQSAGARIRTTTTRWCSSTS